MGEICRFGDNEALRCILSAAKIRGLKSLEIIGESTTEAATSNGQEYMKRKSGKPLMVNMSVVLSAFTGCSTRSEVMELVAAARDGQVDYLYVGGEKLTPCKLMLTRADANEFVITAGGKLAHCVVALVFQQASLNDGAEETKKKSSSGWKSYEVFVPGRGTKKVKAGSPEAALNAAFPGHTGTYYVDGKGYRGTGGSGVKATAKSTGTSATVSAGKLVTDTAKSTETSAAVSAAKRVTDNAKDNSAKQKAAAAAAARQKQRTTNKGALAALRNVIK